MCFYALSLSYITSQNGQAHFKNLVTKCCKILKVCQTILRRYALGLHWKLSTILKTSKKLYEVMFFCDVKVYTCWKFIQYTIPWDETRLITPVPTHCSFTFHSRFLYELKLKVRLSENFVWDFPFFIVSFLLSLYFCSRKSMDSLILKRHNSSQNQNNRKATHTFIPKPLIFKLQQDI